MCLPPLPRVFGVSRSCVVPCCVPSPPTRAVPPRACPLLASPASLHGFCPSGLEREIDCGLFLVSEAYHLGQEETDWFDKPREARVERVRHYGGHSSSQKRPPVKHTYHDYDEPPDEDPWQHDDYPQHREHRHHGEYGRHTSTSRHASDEPPRRSAKQHPREPSRHEPRGHGPPAASKKAQQPEPRGPAPYGPGSSEYPPSSRPAAHHHGAETPKAQKPPQPHGPATPAPKPEPLAHPQQPAARQQQAGQQAARQQAAARQAAQPAGSAQPEARGRTQGPPSSRPPQQQPGPAQVAGKVPAALHAQPGGHAAPAVSTGSTGSAASLPRGSARDRPGWLWPGASRERVGDGSRGARGIPPVTPPQPPLGAAGAAVPSRRPGRGHPCALDPSLPFLGLQGHFPTGFGGFGVASQPGPPLKDALAGWRALRALLPISAESRADGRIQTRSESATAAGESARGTAPGSSRSVGTAARCHCPLHWLPGTPGS